MAQMQTDDFRPPVVALVDDEAQIVDALEALLSFRGIVSSVHRSAESLLQVLSVQNGRLCLQDRNGQHAVLTSVVLDMNLPGMNGANLVVALRKWQPDLNIVMMTAAQEAQLRSHAKELEGVILLAKPFTLESLERALRLV